jgi:Sec-independent protein translocase protein TatA
MIAAFPGWDGMLIVAVIVVLYGAKKLPPLFRGFRQGLTEFGKATRDLVDGEAAEAGKSLGGIYGKPAAQALTPGNEVAELYDRPVAHKNGRRLVFVAMLRAWWQRVKRIFNG